MKQQKDIEEIKHQIIESTNSDDLIFTGRAASAFLIAFKAIKNSSTVSNPEVIMPSISCATPANTALMTGLKPRFADIDMNNGLCTLSHIKERYNKNTVAVVFIHSFGNTQDLIQLRKWCDENKILLLEDNAQALGAYLPCENPVGFYGDFSIYSFGVTKIIETGGGALLIKNKSFTKECHLALKHILSLYTEIPDAERQALSNSYRNLHHGLVDLDRIKKAPKIDTFFLMLQKAYEPLYILEHKINENFITSWNNLEETNQTRIEKANKYADEFNKNPNIQIISQYNKSKVCWRYSLLIDKEDDLISISDKIRKDGFHVSNLYWPVSFFFKSDDICVNAYTFARRIINLWVDSSVDELYVKKCAQSLIKHVEES